MDENEKEGLQWEALSLSGVRPILYALPNGVLDETFQKDRTAFPHPARVLPLHPLHCRLHIPEAPGRRGSFFCPSEKVVGIGGKRGGGGLAGWRTESGSSGPRHCIAWFPYYQCGRFLP